VARLDAMLFPLIGWPARPEAWIAS
jgi:hypothetical protein